MKENQLSRYGAIAKVLKELGPTGKVFFAVSNADAIFAEFQHEFPRDRDGVDRVYSTIQGALDACVAGRGDVVLVMPKTMAQTDTDPSSWAETLTMTKSLVSLVGIPSNITQGGLPQIRKGSGTTALLTIQAPGCLVKNLGFNGIQTSDSTQSLKGIVLDDDGGSTKSAFGTTIEGCHFKNCAGANSSVNAAQGGAINWASTGGAWQVRIKGNTFYKNVGDIVLIGTSGSVPQDVIIEDNIFSGPAAYVDCQLYLAGGSGMASVVIRNNIFPAFPAIGSGTNLRFADLTGCTGIMCNNYFASNAKTFKAAGSGAKIPATVFLTGNYQESTGSAASLIDRTT